MQGFPLQDEIMTAVQNPALFICDPQLKKARLLVQQPYSGGFAMAFKVEVDGRKFALRCWTQGIGDSEHHYEAVDRYLSSKKLRYFVDFKFIKDGILVNGQRYPVLRMDWLDSDSLGQFIQKNLKQANYIEQAAEAFLVMCASLHRARISHGDLQAENIKVIQRVSGFDLQLIDYDTIYVPAMGSRAVINKGLASYQHAKRSNSVTMSDKDDYFSELVIYLSLRALAEQNALWGEFNFDEKNLLFTQTDFDSAKPTAIFHRLYKMSPFVQRLAVVLWNFSRCPNIQLLLPLEKVVELVNQSAPAVSPTQATSAVSGVSSFDRFLKDKLNNLVPPTTLSRTGAKTGSWLDDAAFQGAPAVVKPIRKPTNAFPVLPTVTATPSAQYRPPTNQTGTTTSPQTSTPPPSKGFIEQIWDSIGGTVIVIFVIYCLVQCSKSSKTPPRKNPPTPSSQYYNY